MFQKTDTNVLEATITHFSRELAYSYILRLRRGGVENILLHSFKVMNLSGASKTIGNQILDIKEYYEVLYPDSWQKKFFNDFILDIASKGLSTSSKQTVRERLNLLVQENSSYSGRLGYNLKKIESDVIFENLKNNFPLVPPDFTTSEEAQKYISRTFAIIRSVLSKVWIKKILRSGFELYIESPVKSVWQNEMEDLYFKSKEAFIEWYKTYPSIKDITLKYHDKFLQKSKRLTKENVLGFKFYIGWLIDSLKISRFIE